MATQDEGARIRVRYPEVDRMGVAHHTAHFVWSEIGRTELMRGRGVPYGRVEDDEGILLPVIDASCTYHAPARYDDLLHVRTTVSGVRGVRVTFSYRIERETDGTLLASGSTVHAAVDRSGRPRRLPASLRGLLRMLVFALCLPAALVGCAGRDGKKPVLLEPPEAIYERALKKIEKKKYYSARNMLQTILPRIAPDDRDLLPKVQLAIADAFFKDRGLLNYGEALNGYRNFLTYFPDHPRSDHAQYMVGMSLFEQVLAPDRDQALTLKAIDEFRKVEVVFPDSPYVERARRRIDECYDLLAEHERVVGRFYQQRKAWGAAIDRYRTILVQYPRFRKTPQVLYDLGVCLLKTGKRTEAQAFFGRLARESPENNLVKNATRRLEKDARRREKASRRDDDS